MKRKDFITLASSASLALAFRPKKHNKSIGHNKVKPRRLKKGDTLGLIAPASPIYSQTQFDAMLKNVSSLGFKVKIGSYANSKYGYLAGTDEQRLEDLHSAFSDPDINGIMCIRGGWGSNRLLDMIDYSLIRDNPKVFIGFSDITSLHHAFLSQANLTTFHGPVGKSDWTATTLRSFSNNLLEGDTEQHRFIDQNDGFILHPGKASGHLIGGNLTVLTSLIGSRYIADFEHAILFLEDVGESVYRIDRMLTQLKLAGLLQKINGLVIGKFTDAKDGVNSLTLREMLEGHIRPLQIPAYYGALISHEKDNITIPVGCEASLDTDHLQLTVLESGVL
ncbi:MAG: LD-carboxypeptidase [Bacteroidota bacterium]